MLAATATAVPLVPVAVSAGPVVCTTTVEAPQAGGAPVEVSRCGVVTTTSALVERRFASYRAPYARGIDITHQITDLLGIAMGGGDGTRLMGLGFPDQTIVWDGSALENTYRMLLEQQSPPQPWRTADLNNGFCQGLSGGSCALPGASAASSVAWPQPGAQVVRGLW